MSMHRPLGATPVGVDQCQFVVWAPFVQTVQVHITAPQERRVALEKDAHGYHHALVDGVAPGSLYLYQLDNQQACPDPASRYQPQDIHGPSQVVDAAFAWEDQAWSGLSLAEYILYELHVGTFTPEGTFEAIIPYLDELKDIGITALELMPVAQFPGSRNWGYDGVYPFAAQASYGGPEGLQRLVNACHQKGLAVVLDVVYNHLGPEGSYLGDFGPYFTDRYKTPWGLALNFDGPHSDDVRRFFIDNALYWITACHIDALRLDAIHAIVDHSARTFLEDLGASVQEQAAQLHRWVYLIAESDLNASRVIRPRELGGYGLDAQWSDDFHHALHTLVTGEHSGYYSDFGHVAHLGKALAEGYVYAGQYSAFRQRRHGDASRHLAAHQFVVCAQNHDQVGNRMRGERLSQLTSFEGLKLAAGMVLLSPCIPLLFMGEEYGETAPFPYFIRHTDPALVEAVRQGRREEFAAFRWQGETPDPQDEATFHSARLNHAWRYAGHHEVLRALYRELIHLRTTLPALARLTRDTLEVHSFASAQLLSMHRWHDETAVFILAHFGATQASVPVPMPVGQWHKRLDSADVQWRGPGSLTPIQLTEADATVTLAPQSVVLFTRDDTARRP